MGVERDLSIRLESDILTGEELIIHRVEGRERISQLFEYKILASRVEGTYIDPDEHMLKPASISLATADAEVHRLFGIISEVRDLAETTTVDPRVELTFVPSTFAATMRTTLDIFMEMSVPDIVDACLTRCGLTAGTHYDLGGLVAEYPPKEFVVQYNETDYAFICRLCEHHGIFFFFDFSTGKDVMVFGDGNDAFPTVERTPEVPFTPVDSEGGMFIDRIGSVDVVSRPMPKRYVLRDYNYRIPGVDLMAEAEVNPDGLGEVVEYGAHFKGPNEGTALANIRAQELLTQRRIWHGAGTAPSLSAGHKFTMTLHPGGDSELLVTGVRQAWGPGGSSESTLLTTTFDAVPAETLYRPPRLTPKPKVNGAITGMIDATDQSDYAEVDDQGRYRVRFMYDTAERGEGQASRLVRMMQPHAGEGYGMHFPLRPGVEVLLTCLDGDPDRPIISGTVPNPKTASPVTGANRDRNLIRTGGGNEIDISDEDGEARIKMTTPYMGTVFQLGAPNEPEIGAILKTTGNVVNTAKDTIGTGAAVVSAIADVQSGLVGKNITSFAGIPNKIEGFDKFEKFASSGLAALKGLANLGDSVLAPTKEWEEGSKAAADGDQKTAEDAVLAKYDPKKKYPDDAKKVMAGTAPNQIEVTETEAQFRDRLIQEKLDSMAAGDTTAVAEGAALQSAVTSTTEAAKAEDGKSSAYEWYKDTVKPYTDGASDVIGMAEGALATVKTVKETWSKWHKRLSKGGDAIAYAKALGEIDTVTVDALGSSSPRHSPLTLRTPGECYNLITATDSVVLVGDQGAYLASMINTAVVGKSHVRIASGDNMQIQGSNLLEISADKVYITSTDLLDVKSTKEIEVYSGKNTKITVKEKMTTVSDDDMSIESKKKYLLKAKDLIEAKADKITYAAEKTSFFIDTKEDLAVKSKRDTKLVADRNVFVEGKKKVSIKWPSGSLISENPKTLLKHGGSQVEMKSSKMTLKTSTLELKASTFKATGSGGVTVKGSTIKLG